MCTSSWPTTVSKRRCDRALKIRTAMTAVTRIAAAIAAAMTAVTFPNQPLPCDSLYSAMRPAASGSPGKYARDPPAKNERA